MIKVENIHKTYHMGSNSLHVLKGVDVDIKEGEMVSIMGSSGSGKSTLLNILGILDTYDSGSYHLDGMPIGPMSEAKAARYRNQYIGFVFQSFNLITFKNALENVALPLYYQNVSRRKRNRIAMEYLDRMGLADHAMHMPNEMSGGQKQRIAIARALIADPRIILADEPTGALDSRSTDELLRLFGQINGRGQTILMVTHSVKAASHAGRVLFIKDGEVFHQIYRGQSSDQQLYQKISDTLTMLATGGDKE